VEAARARQRVRYRDVAGVGANAHAPPRWLDRNGGVQAEARDLLAGAAERLEFTARAYHRVLRVARTIADLDGSAAVGPSHVAEAIGYRPAR
jgi:magnesium chelatase family protein